MKHAFKLFCKAFGFVILCIAFLFLWNSLRISKSIEDGAFEKAVFCIDEHHIHKTKNGKPTKYILEWVIVEQIGHETYGLRAMKISWHLNQAINYFTIRMLWSEEEKLKLYNLMIDDAQHCSSFK